MSKLNLNLHLDLVSLAMVSALMASQPGKHELPIQ